MWLGILEECPGVNGIPIFSEPAWLSHSFFWLPLTGWFLVPLVWNLFYLAIITNSENAQPEKIGLSSENPTSFFCQNFCKQIQLLEWQYEDPTMHLFADVTSFLGHIFVKDVDDVLSSLIVKRSWMNLDVLW